MKNTKKNKTIIYDFGANTGLNIPYYLHKSDLVVAVEANPSLADLLSEKYSDQIKKGLLVVVNAALTDVKAESITFYRHKISSVHSQLPQPSPRESDQFEPIIVPAISPVDLINKYGEAYYIKIDIEHMDHKILALILSSDIFPPFISVESHSLKVLSLLSSKYSSFKVVNGLDVGRYIKRSQVYSTKLGKYITYSFPKHSAGPFGDDIRGEWVSETRFIRKLAIEGLGWVDIHCSRNQKSHLDTMTGREFLLKSFIGFLRNSVLQARPFRYFLLLFQN